VTGTADVGQQARQRPAQRDDSQSVGVLQRGVGNAPGRLDFPGAAPRRGQDDVRFHGVTRRTERRGQLYGALGVGRFAASAAALRRAGELLTRSVAPRLRVRLAWVSAELAMASGDGPTAVGHAERAIELAATLGSARHTVKSDMVLAAALCSAGDIDRSRMVADAALDAAGGLGMIPLCWALACLLADIGSACHSAADVLRIRNECAATVRRRGGDMADR
jgi:hypothetical protein